MRRHFPTLQARKVADEAIDALPVEAPMSTYLDTWITSYVKAGGLTKIKLD